jgi:hypothetical protein
MATKFFRVVATDNVPSFQSISQWAGVWFGVAAVDDVALQEKLISQGKAELTEAEYESELKKKPGMQGSFPDWREVAGSGVQMAAKHAAPVEPQQPISQQGQSEPPIEPVNAGAPPDGSQAVAPAPLPKARVKSAQKP